MAHDEAQVPTSTMQENLRNRIRKRGTSLVAPPFLTGLSIVFWRMRRGFGSMSKL
jgi:hypothetical protein